MIRVPKRFRIRDSEQLAAHAGLRHLTDDEPGVRRRRQGTGFSYVDATGAVLGGSDRRRLEALAIPPAWDEVWMAPSPDSHLLATGRDGEGRKQYRYHDDFVALTRRLKFARLAYFGRALRRLRPAIDSELSSGKPGTASFALASATRILDVGLLRVGNDLYRRSSGAQGATTLTAADVDDLATTSGELSISFVGKGGVNREIAIDDPTLTTAIDELMDLPEQALFAYLDNGTAASITSTDLNTYIADIIGPAFTAKDFRTWGGTVATAEALVNGERAVDAYDEAAEALGNTRAVARDSYVAPAIPEAAENEHLLEAYRRSRSGRWLSRVESTVEKVLQANLSVDNECHGAETDDRRGQEGSA